MGYNKSEATPGMDGGLISWAMGERQIHDIDHGLEFAFNNASISSPEGDLLFYTNGCTVYDSTFNLMEGGDTINYNEWYDQICDGSASGFQSTMVLPDPGYDDGYYILHQPLAFLEDPFDLQSIELRYSYVDMLQGAHGAVTARDEVYFQDTIGSGLFSACQHANGADWWFIKNEYQSDCKYIFLLSEAGIDLVHMIAIGDTIGPSESGGGQAKFSPDGSMYATGTAWTGVNLYDFDRETGVLSNHEQFRIRDLQLQSTGLEWSPSGQFLYYNFQGLLYQLDVWAEDIEDEITFIDTFDGFVDPFAVSFGPQQRGPDCKIYLAGGSTVPYLHVINQPDQKGVGCHFRQHSISLPFNNDIVSIPHFPNFRIDEDDVCDPTITSVFGFPVVIDDLEVYPNPARDRISIDGNDHMGSSYALINQTGHQVTAGVIQADHSIDVSSLLPGLYFLKVTSDRRIDLSRIVIER